MRKEYLLGFVKFILYVEERLKERLKRKLFPNQQGLSFYERLPKESFPGVIKDDVRVPFFVHIHLPKTGGTSFNRVLEKNFSRHSQLPHDNPGGFERFEGRFIFLFDKFSNEQIKKFMEVHTTINCVASHNFSAILPYQSASRKIIVITFVRDPVDRYFSSYFHLRFRGGNFIQAEKDIDEYVSHTLSTLKPNQRLSGYLYQLTGEETEGSFRYIEELVENNHLYLFNTYRMKEACEVMKKKFPNYFKDIDFEIKNVSKKDQIVSKEHRNSVREKVSQYDFRLLDLANKNLDKLLKNPGRQVEY